MQLTSDRIPLPSGYRIGMRVRTNSLYAVCYKRACGPYLGTIVGGSKGNDGPLKIKLDHQMYSRTFPTKLFDIIEP